MIVYIAAEIFPTYTGSARDQKDYPRLVSTKWSETHLITKAQKPHCQSSENDCKVEP